MTDSWGNVSGLIDGDGYRGFAIQPAVNGSHELDTAQILERVVNLPIMTWNYKHDDRTVRHIGAVAQDFAAAFEVGGDDKNIARVDADGVALAAIQGLNAKLEQKTAEFEELQARFAELEATIRELARE